MRFGFVPLRNGFGYEISMTVGFAGFRDFKDGRYCFITSFQWQSVLLGFAISKTVGIVSLPVFNGSRYWWVMRFQRRSVLFHYEFSMAVGFGGLRDRNDGMFSVSVFFLLRDFKNSRFCFVTSFQWPSVLVGLCDLSDGRFFWVARSQ